MIFLYLIFERLFLIHSDKKGRAIDEKQNSHQTESTSRIEGLRRPEFSELYPTSHTGRRSREGSRSIKWKYRQTIPTIVNRLANCSHENSLDTSTTSIDCYGLIWWTEMTMLSWQLTTPHSLRFSFPAYAPILCMQMNLWSKEHVQLRSSFFITDSPLLTKVPEFLTISVLMHQSTSG